MDRYEHDIIFESLGEYNMHVRSEEEIRALLINNLQSNLKIIRKEILNVSQDDFSKMLGLSKPTIVKFEKQKNSIMSYKEYMIIGAYIEYEFRKLLQEKDKKCLRICELLFPEMFDILNKLLNGKPIPVGDFNYLINFTPCTTYLDTFKYEKKLNPKELGEKYPNSPIVIASNAWHNNYKDLEQMINFAKKIENERKIKQGIFVEQRTIEVLCEHLGENIDDMNAIHGSHKVIKKISSELEEGVIKRIDMRERYLGDKSINMNNKYLYLTNISEFDYPSYLCRSVILLSVLDIINKYEQLWNNPLSWEYDIEVNRESFYFSKGKLWKRKPWNIVMLYCGGVTEIDKVYEYDKKGKEAFIYEQLNRLLEYIDDTSLLSQNERSSIYEELRKKIEQCLDICEFSTQSKLKKQVLELLKKYKPDK